MAWGYKASITIDHTKCGTGNSSDFPFLVSGTYDGTGGEPDLRVTGSGGRVTSSDGFDICFYSDAGLTTQIPHEIESYAPTTGVINMWVRVATLDVSSDVVIYMAYGDASITTSQEDKSNLWTNFIHVFHLTNLTNSKGAITLTNTGGSATPVAINDGYSIPVGENRLNMSAPFTVVNTFSIQFWGYQTSDAADRVIMANQSSNNGFVSFNQGNYFYSFSNSGSQKSFTSLTAFKTLALYTITHDLSDGVAGYKVYKDGGIVQSLTPYTEDDGITIDTLGNYRTYTNSITGYLDEVRYSNSVLSSSWITADYNSEKNPSTFYAMGAETPAGGGGGGVTVNYIGGAASGLVCTMI